MTLGVRPRVYSLPSYSLTGDILSYLRCGLQYRYTRIGKLPASRPVQLWFGNFIHGVLEEAFRRYRESATRGTPELPPWPNAEIDSILDLIKARLSAQGLFAWDDDLERLGDERARAAIQELGPALFPIISRAEVRLTGTRQLPPIASSLQFREADRYEMVGVVDVVTSVELNDPARRRNEIVRRVVMELPNWPPDEFEIIVDYKGTRRPPTVTGAGGLPSLREQYEWQLQTYGDLRQRQADARPVAAGLLVYLNELYPTKTDMMSLQRELARGQTDVVPARGSLAERLIGRWTSGDDVPELPMEFRLDRALRVVPIDQASIDAALAAFDDVVRRMETCRGRELRGNQVIPSWDKNADDETVCAACDARTYCPDFQSRYARRRREQSPRLPGAPIVARRGRRSLGT